MDGKSNMKHKKYGKYLKYIWITALLLSAAVIFGVYICQGNLEKTVIAAAGMTGMAICIYLQYHLDKWYLEGIITDLSNLMDILMKLEVREVFPANEDTLVSKLQNQAVRLMKILKWQADESEKGQENIKALVSNISHQLKTPLANLKMYTEFLEEKELTEEQRSYYVKIIYMSVERLQFLTESMIKVSRLENGLIRLEPKMQSLNETVLKAVKDVYTKAVERGVEICYKESESVEVLHDRNWTAEAVFNLLDNGVKYAKKGTSLSLSVSTTAMFAMVCVEDENGAIPEEEQAKIFQRFYRGSNSTAQEGMGIGLYLTREIVVRQGGYIKMRTTEKGNVFWVCLTLS